jgi:hypothetical protein
MTKRLEGLSAGPCSNVLLQRDARQFHSRVGIDSQANSSFRLLAAAGQLTHTMIRVAKIKLCLLRWSGQSRFPVSMNYPISSSGCPNDPASLRESMDAGKTHRLYPSYL